MALLDKDSKLPLNTCPIGYLKAAEVATTTTAIMFCAGTTLTVRLVYA